MQSTTHFTQQISEE